MPKGDKDSPHHRCRSALRLCVVGFILVAVTIAAACVVIAIGFGGTIPSIPLRHPSVPTVIGAVLAVVGFGILFRVLALRVIKLQHRYAELKQSEERFRSFALASSDWFWETDAQHRFTYISEGIRDFGQDPRSRIGKTRIELAAAGERGEGKWREHQAVLDRHEPFRNFIYRRKVAHEPEHTITVSGEPFFDPSGRFLGYRGTARDISPEVAARESLREAKAAAEAASHAKSQFLANMSHELRTPLNAIIGFAQAIQLGMAGPVGKQLGEYVGFIQKSGEHLLNIISDILDLTKVDAGKFELQQQSGLDARDIAESCVSLVKERATSGGLHLSTEIEDDLPSLTADPTRVKQILLNVLSNAIKFTESGGSVVLAVSHAAEGGLRFEVRDSGRGMTPEEIKLALEPFGQVDGNLDRRHEGTGLGLPLARCLAELHGGSLDIASEKGRGTRVTLILPGSRVSDALTMRAASG